MTVTMRVRDVMSTAPITIGSRANIGAAMRLMLEHRISGLPVVDPQNRLVGMVTEGDFLRRAETGTQRARPHWLEVLISPGKLAAEYVHSHGSNVDEIMTHEVVATDVDAPLSEAVELMQRQRIKRLPVLERERLVGLLSRADLMRAFLNVVPHDSIASADDATIAARISEGMRQQPWCPRENVRVEVRAGIAELLGVVTDERTRDGLRVLVENTAGVTHVIDNLTTVEPMTGMIVRTPTVGGGRP